MELLTSIVIVDVVNKEYLWQDAASFPTEGWSKSLRMQINSGTEKKLLLQSLTVIHT